jgi:Cu(I)/Ag(I) efflux system membrane fusion protein
VGTWTYHVSTRSSAGSAQGQKFICPMHPQIVTDHKGECPICGMDLVPSGTTATPATATPAAAEHGAHGATPGATEYTCPMHPDFITHDGKARCPECKMKLVVREAAGVPGLVPVELSAERIQLMGMKTAVAAVEPLATTLRAAGFVTASEDGLISVNARYSGWVENLPVAQIGQPVKTGDVLATIYSPELLNAQQIFLNALKWSDRKGAAPAAPATTNDLEREARQRLELLGVAPRDVDAIAAAGQPMRAVPVRAPGRGFVVRKSVVKGASVQSGTELFQLADLSTVWVLVDVPEGDLARVRLGQKATFEVASAPGQGHAGRVQFIYPGLNAGSRTLQARVELANPKLELRPGMFGDVTLETDAAEAVVIPSDALVDTGDHRYVFVDRGGGRFEPRSVRPGARDGARVAILSGLAAGERVVTRASFLLDSESRMRAAVEGHGK